MNPQVMDPLESAVSDAESFAHFFGKLEISAQFVTLKKGQPKTTWIEGDPTEGRTTEVTMRLNPLDISGLTRMTERSVMSNSGEWSKIVWPSLRDLGVKALGDLRGNWAHVQMVPNGRTWLNKEGETVNGTTFKFVKLFTLESDCVKAWEEQFGSQPKGAGNATAQAVSPGNDAEKAAAAQFLPHIVNAHKSDLPALAATLASMAPLNKYFTVDSPEVQALLKAA